MRGRIDGVKEVHSRRSLQIAVYLKQKEIVTGRLCGSVAQLAQCSYCTRHFLGSILRRVMCFHNSVTHVCMTFIIVHQKTQELVSWLILKLYKYCLCQS